MVGILKLTKHETSLRIKIKSLQNKHTQNLFASYVKYQIQGKSIEYTKKTFWSSIGYEISSFDYLLNKCSCVLIWMNTETFLGLEPVRIQHFIYQSCIIHIGTYAQPLITLMYVPWSLIYFTNIH